MKGRNGKEYMFSIKYSLSHLWLFMNKVNDILHLALSQYAATSLTEVSNADVDFTEAGLMSFTNNIPPLNC